MGAWEIQKLGGNKKKTFNFLTSKRRSHKRCSCKQLKSFRFIRAGRTGALIWQFMMFQSAEWKKCVSWLLF